MTAKIGRGSDSLPFGRGSDVAVDGNSSPDKHLPNGSEWQHPTAISKDGIGLAESGSYLSRDEVWAAADARFKAGWT